jgi:hypothetical protein
MPKMNLRTDSYAGYAATNEKTGNIELLSLAEIKEKIPRASYVCEENLIQTYIKPGENFCYHLEDSEQGEVGFAQLAKSGRKYILQREIPLWQYLKKDGTQKFRVSTFIDFKRAPLFLYSTAPEFEDCLSYENSVLCTSKPYHQTPVELQNNTLLGCKDDTVQSIDGAEFVEMFGGVIADSINEKSLVLNSIRLKPTPRMLNPVRGTIIYNAETNRLEFYNGQDWSAI